MSWRFFGRMAAVTAALDQRVSWLYRYVLDHFVLDMCLNIL
jgi:hypothetical protein